LPAQLALPPRSRLAAPPRPQEESGKTFTQIADEVGLSNVYLAMLLYNQVRMGRCMQAAGWEHFNSGH